MLTQVNTSFGQVLTHICVNTSISVSTPLQNGSKSAQNWLKIAQLINTAPKSLKIGSKLLKICLLAALAVDLESFFVLTPVLTPGLAVLTPLAVLTLSAVVVLIQCVNSCLKCVNSKP